MSDEDLAPSEAHNEVPTQPPSPPPKSPPDFTPEAFVKALEGTITRAVDSVRSDVTAQIGAMSSSLDKHADAEQTALELISYNVKAIQTDVDQLVRTYREVLVKIESHNTRLGSHDDRIQRLEDDLKIERQRIERIEHELQDLKSAAR